MDSLNWKAKILKILNDDEKINNENGIILFANASFLFQKNALNINEIKTAITVNQKKLLKKNFF